MDIERNEKRKFNVFNTDNKIYLSCIANCCPFCMKRVEKCFFGYNSLADNDIRTIKLGYCRPCNQYCISEATLNRIINNNTPLLDIYDVITKFKIKNGLVVEKRILNKLYSSEKQNIKIDILKRDTLFSYENKSILHISTSKKCFADKHNIKDILGKVNILMSNGDIEETRFNACICEYCGRFYIHDKVYKSVSADEINVVKKMQLSTRIINDDESVTGI